LDIDASVWDLVFVFACALFALLEGGKVRSWSRFARRNEQDTQDERNEQEEQSGQG